MTAGELIRAHRADIVRVARSHKAKGVRVFGSAARGEATQASDIDLLVAMKPGADLLDIVAIKQDLEDLLGLPIDIVTENSISPYMRDEVLKEAIDL